MLVYRYCGFKKLKLTCLALQMAKSEKEEALAALEDASKESHQALLDHNEAMRSLNESRDQALETANNETILLEEQLAEKEAQLNDITTQLCDKGSSLEAMQAQARKREQILSNLRQNLQYRGTNPSIGLVTASKSMWWTKQRYYLDASLQLERVSLNYNESAKYRATAICKPHCLCFLDLKFAPIVGAMQCLTKMLDQHSAAKALHHKARSETKD